MRRKRTTIMKVGSKQNGKKQKNNSNSLGENTSFHLEQKFIFKQHITKPALMWWLSFGLASALLRLLNAVQTLRMC